MIHPMSIPDTVAVAAVGDIQLHGRYRDAARSGDAAGFFVPLKRLLDGVDIGIGNMETVLADECAPRRDKLCLLSAPAYAPILRDAGLNVMTVANNHFLDYGADGVAATLRHLRQAGIRAVGGGLDLNAATLPAVVEQYGIRLGFLAACHESTGVTEFASASSPGAAPLSPETLLPAIAALKSQVDHVIVLLHWGLEYSHVPTPEQVALAHAVIDQGASAILGHHSHVIQGIEHYGDGVIAYSLGNLTDAPVDWQGPTRHYQCGVDEVDRESILLKLAVSKQRVRLGEVIPLWLDDEGRPTAASGARGEKILKSVDEYSAMLRDRDLERYWRETVIGSRVAAPLVSWWREGSLWDKIRNFRPGQLLSAWLLLRTWLELKFSRSESRWRLFNSRNDTRPMPSARREKGDE